MKPKSLLIIGGSGFFGKSILKYLSINNFTNIKIDKIFIDRKTNYYTINVRLFNDMTALGYVYIIENKKKKQKQELETITTAPKK